MSIFRRDTGNWAEDLGRGLQEMLYLGLAALFIIPALVVVIILLMVFK